MQDGTTPLLAACMRGHSEAAMELLYSGADANASRQVCAQRPRTTCRCTAAWLCLHNWVVRLFSTTF